MDDRRRFAAERECEGGAPRRQADHDAELKPPGQGITGAAALLTALQRGAGNAAVGTLLRRFAAQRMAAEDGRGGVAQAKAEVGFEGGTVSPGVAARIEAKRGGGAPLAEDTRGRMETAFDADFAGVRMHTDADAHDLNRSVNATAFTTGSDIFFGQGAYSPGSGTGDHLLAHELTHVVQQRGAGGAGAVTQASLTVSSAGDAAEREAEAVADLVAAGGQARVAETATAGLHGNWLTHAANTVGEALGYLPEGETEWSDYQHALDNLHAFSAQPHTASNFQPSTGLGLFDVTYTPSAGSLEIVCKCKFNFVNGVATEYPGATPADLNWTPEQKKTWTANYLSTVNGAWSGHHTFHCHKDWWESLSGTVAVHFVEADSAEQFVLDVTKIPKGEFRRSNVSAPSVGTFGGVTPGHGEFDSEDLSSVGKPGGTQTPAAHEAGHMLGLDDEYNTGETGAPSHSADVEKEFGHEVKRGADGRIMSGGMDILPEHGVTFLEAIKKATDMEEWATEAKPPRAAPPDPSLRNVGDFPPPPSDNVPA